MIIPVSLRPQALKSIEPIRAVVKLWGPAHQERTDDTEEASKPSTGLILLNGMIVIFVPTWINHIDWNNISCCTHLTLLVWHGNSYCSCRLRTTNLIASVSKLVCQYTSIQSLEGLSLIDYGFRFSRKRPISTRPCETLAGIRKPEMKPYS